MALGGLRFGLALRSGKSWPGTVPVGAGGYHRRPLAKRRWEGQIVGRRALQVVLAVLATVAVASGLAGMLLGPAALPGARAVDATVDSEYRFVNAFWFGAGVLVWWAVPRVDRASVLLRLTLGAAFLGGLARLLAAAASGWPHPVLLGVLVVELLVVPCVVLWQGRVARAAAEASATIHAQVGTSDERDSEGCP
jgi:hypothetical protein